MIRCRHFFFFFFSAFAKTAKLKRTSSITEQSSSRLFDPGGASIRHAVGAERSFRHMCAMQSSRTSAVGQLCFYGQTEKGIFCLFRGQEELGGKCTIEKRRLFGPSKSG